MKIKTTILFGVLLFTVSCTNKPLDLAHRYENTESQKLYEYRLDTMKFIEYDTFEMTDRIGIYKPTNVPKYKYWLDAKTTVIKFSWDTEFTTFWSSSTTYMQKGCKNPWLEENIQLITSSMGCYGKAFQDHVVENFTDGGTWFIGTHELPGEKIVAFFSAESNWEGVSSSAYKSIGVTYSSDHGKTWDAPTMILSGPEPRPSLGEAKKTYGIGDGCVVWNSDRNAWMCYYSGKCEDTEKYMICMAESKDTEGAAGTWKKWNGKDFTGEGCNARTGRGANDYCISGFKSYPGASPSVMWNSDKKVWMMVYHSSTNEIVYGESSDGINWKNVQVMVDSIMEPDGCMYPNLMCENGDTEGSNQFRLYYSYGIKSSGERSLGVRLIKLK